MVETLVEGLETEWVVSILFFPIIALINFFSGK